MFAICKYCAITLRRKGKKEEMKSNKTLIAVLQGIVVLLLGIFVAVFGVGATLNVYFGIVACVLGAFLVAFSLFLVLKGEVLTFAPLALGGALIGVSVGVFTNVISFAMLITILIFALMGLSGGLVLYGIYNMTKYSLFYGLGQMVIGGGILALTLVYHFNPDFAKVFWIIVGILIAVYGGLQIIFALTKKK